MMDWRVTPSRRASRSSDSIIHDGKSTLTRRCSSAGRRIAARSRSPVTSSPSSNFRSNSSALIQCHLLLPGTARRDDPDPLLTVGHHHRPVLTVDLADHQPSWLICCPCRDLYTHEVLPDRFDTVEVNTVLLQVRSALSRVKLEFHPTRFPSGIITIPYRHINTSGGIDMRPSFLVMRIDGLSPWLTAEIPRRL